MSQTPKRPGTRDISELKARLGLKKAAPEPGKAPGPAKQSGGLAPPPGLAVPAPTRATASVQVPAIPAASDDPFGNMNAMASMGTAQRAPEFVIVNDGKPVESVSTGSKGAAIAKLIVPAFVALILGWQIGAIGRSAAVYNSGIDAAKNIAGTVARAKKDLSDLQSNLQDALKKSGGKIDPSVTKVLVAAQQKTTFKMSSNEQPDAVKEPEANAPTYRIPQGSLDPGLSGKVVSFWSHVTELSQLIDDHVKAARTDDLAFQAASTAADNAQTTIGGQKILKYAIVLSNPSDADRAAGKATGGYGAEIVEIGPQLCADRSLAKDGVCPDGPPGLGYRTDPSGGGSGSQWTRAEIAKAAAGQAFPLSQLVVLSPTPILDSLVQGTTPSATEVIYQRRVQTILTMIDDLLKEGNSLEQSGLKQKANEGSKFSFFL